MSRKYPLSHLLPEYPRTRHIPHKPNAARDDLVALAHEARPILESEHVDVTEKVDAANSGMCLYDGQPVIRNHNHILRKGYSKDTPAKNQFKNIFNWFYQNKEKFEKINELAGPVSVYGEWMVAVHGLEYDQLPSLFLAFDLYDYESENYVETQAARQFLTAAGFSVVPQLFYGKLDNYEQLEVLANQPSQFTTQGHHREGIYVKVNEGRWVKHRFKMVRQGFVQGGLWDSENLKKNKLGGSQ